MRFSGLFVDPYPHPYDISKAQPRTLQVLKKCVHHLSLPFCSLFLSLRPQQPIPRVALHVAWLSREAVLQHNREAELSNRDAEPTRPRADCKWAAAHFRLCPLRRQWILTSSRMYRYCTHKLHTYSTLHTYNHIHAYIYTVHYTHTIIYIHYISLHHVALHAKKQPKR